MPEVPLCTTVLRHLRFPPRRPLQCPRASPRISLPHIPPINRLANPQRNRPANQVNNLPDSLPPNPVHNQQCSPVNSLHRRRLHSPVVNRPDNQVCDRVRNQVGTLHGSRLHNLVVNHPCNLVRNRGHSQVGSLRGSRLHNLVFNHPDNLVLNHPGSRRVSPQASQVADPHDCPRGNLLVSPAYSRLLSRYNNLAPRLLLIPVVDLRLSQVAAQVSTRVLSRTDNHHRSQVSSQQSNHLLNQLVDQVLYRHLNLRGARLYSLALYPAANHHFSPQVSLAVNQPAGRRRNRARNRALSPRSSLVPSHWRDPAASQRASQQRARQDFQLESGQHFLTIKQLWGVCRLCRTTSGRAVERRLRVQHLASYFCLHLAKW